MSRNISSSRKRNDKTNPDLDEYPPPRRKSRAVKAGNVIIGGGFPVSIQSMTNTDTCDIPATVNQIHQLEEAGCEIIRVAVPNEMAAACLGQIKKQISIPLVADIHFSHKLALNAIKEGVDKIRINPGNIGDNRKVKEVARAAAEAGIPLRIGVNSGSLPEKLSKKYSHSDPRAFVTAALDEIELLEKNNFKNIVISLKSSNIACTLAAHKILAQQVDYPFHLGITEAGTEFAGSIKSAIGIGSLLATGIGDTIRVSLTADPVREIVVAKQILKALNLKKDGIEVISCPTCGRCQIDLIDIARSVEEKTRHIKTPLKVAVMGCVVNGPGEARAADVGIAGGAGFGTLFAHGEILRKVPEKELEQALLAEISRLTGEDI